MIRRELTYFQMTDKLKIERAAYADEEIVRAYGVAGAIAQVLGGKRSKALEGFAKGVRPSYSSPGEVSRKSGPKGIQDYRDMIREKLLPKEPPG